MGSDGELRHIFTLAQAVQEFGIHESILASALSDGSLVPAQSDSNGRPLLKREDLIPIADSHLSARVFAALSGPPDFGSKPTDRQRLLGDVPFLARRLANADYAALTIMNGDGRMTVMFVSGMSQEQADAIGEPPTGRGVLGHMGPNGSTLRLHDIATDGRSVGFPVDHPPMTAMIGAGIESAENGAANLYVTRSPGREPFTAEDQMIVESVAAFAQTALESERMRRVEANLHRQARELETAKSEFLSMISHDLRNPIAAMTMSIEQVAASQMDETQDETIQSLRDSLSGMDSLVENLLDMSRLQSGAFPMDQEICFIADVVSDAASRVMKTPIATDRFIELDVPTELPPVFADPIQLRRVVENLLTNALKYSDGEVRIEGTLSTTGVNCLITDQGAGVPDSEQEMVFDRFYRTKVGNGQAGIGLGLAICKTIIESHSGEIGVRSNDQGGACFWFALPADDT